MGGLSGRIDKILRNPQKLVSACLAVSGPDSPALSQSKAASPILVPSNDPVTREG